MSAAYKTLAFSWASACDSCPSLGHRLAVFHVLGGCVFWGPSRGLVAGWGLSVLTPDTPQAWLCQEVSPVHWYPDSRGNTAQCRITVGPASATLARLWSDSGLWSRQSLGSVSVLLLLWLLDGATVTPPGAATPRPPCGDRVLPHLLLCSYHCDNSAAGRPVQGQRPVNDRFPDPHRSDPPGLCCPGRTCVCSVNCHLCVDLTIPAIT